MALSNCGECQKPISDRATQCPYCGCPAVHASLRERFELGVAMMKDYRDEIERRLMGASTILVGIVALFLGNQAARLALSHRRWLLTLIIVVIVPSLAMYVRNTLHWLRRWRTIRNNTDRLQYMESDFYVRYQDIPRAAAIFYLAPVLSLGLFDLVVIVAIGIGYLPAG